jgi:hypothetical protein
MVCYWGCRDWNLGYMVYYWGCRVWNLGYIIYYLGYRVYPGVPLATRRAGYSPSVSGARSHSMTWTAGKI